MDFIPSLSPCAPKPQGVGFGVGFRIKRIVHHGARWDTQRALLRGERTVFGVELLDPAPPRLRRRLAEDPRGHRWVLPADIPMTVLVETSVPHDYDAATQAPEIFSDAMRLDPDDPKQLLASSVSGGFSASTAAAWSQWQGFVTSFGGCNGSPAGARRYRRGAGSRLIFPRHRQGSKRFPHGNGCSADGGNTLSPSTTKRDASTWRSARSYRRIVAGGFERNSVPHG